MSEAFTPGPWKAFINEPPEDDIVLNDGEAPKFILAVIKHSNKFHDNGKEGHANACLIAQSPKLLALLKHARHYIETPGDFASHEMVELLGDIDYCVTQAEGVDHAPL